MAYKKAHELSRLLDYGFPLTLLGDFAKTTIPKWDQDDHPTSITVIRKFLSGEYKDRYISRALSTLLYRFEHSHDPKLISKDGTLYIQTDALVKTFGLPISSLFLTSTRIQEYIHEGVTKFISIRRHFFLKAQDRPPSRKDTKPENNPSLIFLPLNVYLRVNKWSYDFYMSMLEIPEEEKPPLYPTLAKHLLDLLPTLTSIVPAEYCRIADFKKKLFISVPYIAKTYIKFDQLDRFIEVVNAFMRADPGRKYPEYVAFALRATEHRRKKVIEAPLKKPPEGLEGEYVLDDRVYISAKALERIYHAHQDVFKPMVFHGWKREKEGEHL
jgi:hypothetical protein